MRIEYLNKMMVRLFRVLAILFIVAVILTSCASPESFHQGKGITVYKDDNEEPATGLDKIISLPAIFSGIQRFVDKEFNVVCYVYAGGGISCLNY